MVKLDFSLPDIAALKETGFVADMHFHTSHSHDCRTPVKDIITKARKLGIYVAFTDHNTIAGVLEARKYKDAPIIPGVEICSREGKEVIAYFTDDRKLESFWERRIAPNLIDKNTLRSSRTPFRLSDLLNWLSEEECITYLPHPFGPQPRKSYPFLVRRSHDHLLDMIDSVEIFNASVLRRGNLSALGWAVQLEKGAAGGSDGHHLKWLGRGVTVSTATTVAAHLKAIKQGRVHVYGLELKPHERAFNYANTTVRVKVVRGVRGGIKKGLGLPRKALQRL